jgi:hypothetical protein
LEKNVIIATVQKILQLKIITIPNTHVLSVKVKGEFDNKVMGRLYYNSKKGGLNKLTIPF